MSRAKALATSHLVALAEKATEAGAQHGVLVVLDAEGSVCTYPTEETPLVLLAGMLTFALHLLTNTTSEDDDD
jgi:hypothetical protein